jgi:methanethiol S-methyltransferase
LWDLWDELERGCGRDNCHKQDMGEHFLIIAFWALFGVFHSFFASAAIKQRAEKMMGKYFKWYRPLYSVMAFVQTAAILAYQFSVKSFKLWEPLPGAMFFFGLTGLAGALVMGISIRKYFFRLSGIQVLFKKTPLPVLETTGMHEYVRHPLYAGTLLFAWSAFFLFPVLSYLMACATFTMYTIIGIKLEERKLKTLFGHQYSSYKNHVPMIIPFTKFGKLSKAIPKKLS